MYLVGGELGSYSGRYIGTVDFNTQDWMNWTVPSDLSGSGYQISFSGIGATGGLSQVFSILKPSSELREDINLQSCPISIASNKISYTFTKDLSYGDTGTDVLYLKCFLNQKGFLLGNYMNNVFGAMTKDALLKYQYSKGISPATGAFNPMTRAVVNSETGLPPIVGTSTASIITVTYPNEGEGLVVGKTYEITWKTTGPAVSRNVQIGIIDTRYSTEGGDRSEKVIAQSITNTGKYTWTVPATIGTMNLNDTDKPVYKIIVHSWVDVETGVAVSDSSDKPFSIIKSKDPYYIKILSPNGGEKFKDGENIKIKWDTNLPKNQRLNLFVSLNNLEIGKELGSVVAGVKTATWKAKYIDSIVSTESNPPTTFYSNGNFKLGLTCPFEDKICLRPGGESNYFDTSDSIFKIIPPATPVIDTVNPNEGTVGAQIEITAKNLDEKNTIIRFIGTSNSSGTSTAQYRSLIDGEYALSNVKVLDGKKLLFTIPAYLNKKNVFKGSKTVKVIPGYYQIVIETKEGVSKPFYFKVVDTSIKLPSITVSGVIGEVLANKPNYGYATSVYSTSFEVGVSAKDGDIDFGLDGSLWPAFDTSTQYVELYKNGVMVNAKEYGLLVNYTYPVGTNYSPIDKKFTLPSGKSTKIKVYYTFYVAGSGKDLYELRLKNIGWTSKLKTKQLTPAVATFIVSI